MNIQSVSPQFGVNYDVGYIGFTYVGGLVSTGVAYFERWNRLGDIPVTHTLVVSGENECIEAHLNDGVARAPLAKYFDDPNCRIFFRKPRAWNLALGRRIADAAAAQLGCKYDAGLIVADAAGDTFAGHWINRLLRLWPSRLLGKIFDRPNRWICSELVAYALAQQAEFQGQGILRYPLDTIDPQELFEDQVLFEDWRRFPFIPRLHVTLS